MKKSNNESASLPPAPFQRLSCVFLLLSLVLISCCARKGILSVPLWQLPPHPVRLEPRLRGMRGAYVTSFSRLPWHERGILNLLEPFAVPAVPRGCVGPGGPVVGETLPMTILFYDESFGCDVLSNYNCRGKGRAG